MLQGKDVFGIIPPIITPVDKNENVDKNSFTNLINYVLDGGVHGLFVMGSNGEFYGFNKENQKKAIEICVDVNNKKVPVIAGTSAITTKECISLAKNAKDAGADCLSILTPMFINPNENEMYEHFKTIANSVELPILLYNNPGKTTNNLSVGIVEKLAKIDNIIGIKNTTLDYSASLLMMDATKNIENFEVISGTDYYIYSMLMSGSNGAVAGTANVAPKLVVDIYEKFKKGDFKGSLEAQNKLIPLRKAYGYGTFPVMMKEFLNLLGIDVGVPIKPVGNCSKEKLEECKQILKDLNML